MGEQTGFDEILIISSILAPDLVPALAIPALALVIGAATAVGGSWPGLAERLFGRMLRRG